MAAHVTLLSSAPNRRLAWWLTIGWMVIGVKCVLVPIAIAHWMIPIHPAWVIGPTLFLAAVATLLFIRHAGD